MGNATETLLRVALFSFRKVKKLTINQVVIKVRSIANKFEILVHETKLRLGAKVAIEENPTKLTSWMNLLEINHLSPIAYQ